ncbi:MAG: alpha/beta hydrolase [Planctomycetota bacterium]
MRFCFHYLYFAAITFVAGFASIGFAQTTATAGYETIKFESADGLPITGDLYLKHDKKAPFILLCHQAGWSRGEYREIAPKLNKLGFNCLAIDQRSGKAINGVANETVSAAKAAGKPTEFLDAEQDIVAALKHVRKKYASGKLILWGSSYSSALALRIVGMNKGIADGVMSFAPGEYFVRFGKPEDFIKQGASKLTVPVFITSAKNEYPRWQEIFASIPSKSKSKFVPTTDGNHGSRALFERFEDHGAYWKAVNAFLKPFLKS